jgi:predicted transcriptional regulator
MRTIVDLPETQIAALAALEAKRQTSRAHLVREAIAQYLKRQTPEGAAFGAWQRVATIRDGVALQQELRAEWDRQGS